jgi:hypothetical protein
MQRYPVSAPGKIKHCFLSTEQFKLDVEYVPCLYFEAKIDFADIRSGFHEIRSITKAVDICSIDEEAQWTEDMVRDVDPARVVAPIPQEARLRPLPAPVDVDSIAQAETHFLHYLLRYFKMRIYRNFDLNLYSGPGEILEDFTVRCIEMLSEPFRQDLDILHEVFERKLEQIKGKHLKLNEWGELDPPHRASQLKSILHRFSERLAQLFLSAGLSSRPESSAPPRDNPAKLELEDRLHSLETEALHATHQLANIYQERARNIDEYIVHPNLKDIHLVRTCILWMPAQEHLR